MLILSLKIHNTKKFILLYTIILNVIRQYECLNCYACTGNNDCGILFSPNSNTTKRLKSNGDGFFDVCTISVNSEGITTRDLVDSSQCRSSMNQFCCKEDWCNSLPAPPLPALTDRTCIVDRCVPTSNKCDVISKVATLSSATESCFRTAETPDKTVYMSYKKKCFSDQNALKYSCCNSPQCNQESMQAMAAIHCYTCDSRITGLTGCSILNVSSPNVYQSTSSDPSEACATIIGSKGKVPYTNYSYAAFVIRTFIRNCTNQPQGMVSYGGATFQGQINCCWKNYCNAENLDIYVARSVGKDLRKIFITRIMIFAGLFVLLCAIFLVYQYRRPIFNIRYQRLSIPNDIPLSSITRSIET